MKLFGLLSAFLMSATVMANDQCVARNFLSRDSFDMPAFVLNHCTTSRGGVVNSSECRKILRGDGKWTLGMLNLDEGVGTVKYVMKYNTANDTYSLIGYGRPDEGAGPKNVILEVANLDSEKFTLITALRFIYLSPETAKTCIWKK